MRSAFRVMLRVLLMLAAFGLAPASNATWAPSAPAPFSPKAARAEAFRLASGAKSVLRIDLGAADAAAIEAVRVANGVQFEKRLQIGVGRQLPKQAEMLSESLGWESVPGGVAAQWEITSAGASALRIGLDFARLSPLVEIRFAGSGDMGTVYGPFSSVDIEAMQPTYWSPALEGERATVEVFVADGGSSGDVSLAISQVSHLFVSPAAANAETFAKASQACEVDFICRSASDAALASVGKAVARMTFSDGLGGGTFLCTGTLLNSTAGPVAPYFYSANHCISTQASASTLTTHWFYDRTGCGSGGTSSDYVQVTGGSTLLYNDATTDVLLLRLSQNPPSGAIYAGWDASTLSTGTALTAVHHPAGDLKKVSLGTAGGFSGYGGASGDDHLIALWNSTATGVTEGGSSGSGIFNYAGGYYLLRGGLHGGPSSCTATGTSLRDYYSRLDRAYSFISQYLNPATSCTYSLSPASASVGSGATSGSFTVTTSSGCAWSASSNASWLTSSSSGSGSGSTLYSVAANTGSARTGTITVGGQTFTVSQQAGQTGGSTTNVVGNGGFESGSSSWTQSNSSIIYTDGTHSRTGSGYAWLGGYDNASDSIYQDVTIPSGASAVTFRYWYSIATQETLSSAYDTMRVLIQSPSSGATLATVASYSNLNATSGWVQSPSFDLSAFAGQTIRLRFSATTDASMNTNFFVDDVSLSVTTSGTTSSSNYTALWLNLAEAGWGLNINHQGNIIFATLFTYDSTGQALWLHMSDGTLRSDGSYSGTLYRTTGPAFYAVPFTPFGAANYTPVGTMTVSFASASAGSLVYSVNGVVVSKSIQRYTFGSRATVCVPTTGSRVSLTNYQDLWLNTSEPGWGVNVSHEDNILFATLFTYDASGHDLWLVMSGGVRQTDGSYLGDLYRTTGPAFNAVPFTPIGPSNYTKVGTMRFTFSGGKTGVLTYSVNGTVVTKAITRYEFSSPLPACS